MSNELPRAYIEDAKYFAHELGQGMVSKDDFNKLDDTILELTDDQAVRFYELVLEGVVQVLEDHKKRCQNPEHCRQLMDGEKVINALERRINERKVYTFTEQTQPDTPNHPQDHTTARQVLAMHYLFKLLNLKDVDKTEIARFIHFMNGKNEKNIYDLVCDPLTTKAGNLREQDLKFVRGWFERLKLKGAITLIDNDLDEL
ncbi:hypothetical protein [Fibrisoma limi]|uniref:hypothetical protein n=1 Tax=Fibrisoma limi TaxID=663275 RepID=UPI000586C325|nr:hypothetical protein [Fibrisoma limi]